MSELKMYHVTSSVDVVSGSVTAVRAGPAYLDSKRAQLRVRFPLASSIENCGGSRTRLQGLQIDRKRCSCEEMRLSLVQVRLHSSRHSGYVYRP